MASVISWLSANWQHVIVALLAIDAALIPILPNVTLFEKIQTWLSPLAPK
jgi:hypothetical protein